MQIQEAHEKVKKMAGGKYCETRFCMRTLESVDSFDCSVYIEGGNLATAKSWEDAILQLRLQVFPEPDQEPQIIEA